MGHVREIDAQPGRAPLELSPTHDAGQERLQNREERGADQRPARLAAVGRTGGQLHAVLAKHRPSSCMHEVAKASLPPQAGVITAALGREQQRLPRRPL
jgi:hypothetical protein